MTEGWGTWEEDRRYPSKDRERMVVVYKRTQRYGDDERVFWKNSSRKLTAEERAALPTNAKEAQQ